MACAVGRVDDLVVEDGEVEGESEPDGVGRLHLALGDLERLLVRLLGVLQHGGPVVPGGNLGKVSANMESVSQTGQKALNVGR